MDLDSTKGDETVINSPRREGKGIKVGSAMGILLMQTVRAPEDLANR